MNPPTPTNPSPTPTLIPKNALYPLPNHQKQNKKQTYYPYLLKTLQALSTMHKTNRNKYQSNILQFETADGEAYGDDNGTDGNQQDDFKNQYSTFIQELEETTQKLMSQVFNAQYKPEPCFADYGEHDQEDGHLHQRINKGKNNLLSGSRNSKGYGSRISHSFKAPGFGTVRSEQGMQSFQNFMSRNSKWCEKKQNFINKQIKKKELLQQKQVTGIPQILRGSIQKLQPIYERALQLHASKQKKRAYKQIQQKRKQDEQINSYPFHPQITSKAKTRTLQQYLQDKQQWQKKKNEAREIRKLKQQAEKYSECSFMPSLVSKRIDQKVLGCKPGEKVQERLLRSLEKAFAEI